MCSFVAIARNVDISSTKMTYRLEDHTGVIDAHFWLEDSDGGNANAPQIILNTYCRVYGTVRTQNDRKTVMLFKIEPVTTINEVTTHLLEVLNARYTAEKLAKENSTEYSSEFAGSLANGFGGLAVNNNAPKPSTASVSAASTTGMKGKDLAVFEAIRQFKGERGLSITELLRKFNHINEPEMR